ncbi:MAG: hypothetical protein DRQ41_14300 [Gammaproteobacteria bacterium]|nr:MAG: hypothetical protein DRQ41_14300 [Gammaproteobacteria bacterium]
MVHAWVPHVIQEPRGDGGWLEPLYQRNLEGPGRVISQGRMVELWAGIIVILGDKAFMGFLWVMG